MEKQMKQFGNRWTVEWKIIDKQPTVYVTACPSALTVRFTLTPDKTSFCVDSLTNYGFISHYIVRFAIHKLHALDHKILLRN
jgi:hypothetical protein